MDYFPLQIHSISSILKLHALSYYMDYHLLLLISNLSQAIQSRHLLLHAACTHNCILNKAGTRARTCAFQTCRATPVANPVKAGIQERRNAACPICYTTVGKDRERRIMGYYRCEHTAAVEADRTRFGKLNGHRVMGQSTTQGGTREACINVISGPPSHVSCPAAPALAKHGQACPHNYFSCTPVVCFSGTYSGK